MAKVTVVFEDTPNGVSIEVFLEGDDKASVAARVAREAMAAIGACVDESDHHTK